MNQGKEKAGELIGDLLNKDSSAKESDAKAGSAVEDALGGLLGKKKKEKTTTKTDTSVTDHDTSTVEGEAKKAAKSILGGLLGKKKDTVN